jgi:ABC-type bacteriocin/lantibiotic exporter with double-glycine peptidase domain
MRRFFGVVQQGGTIFNDSVLANITMGSGKVDMADVQRALAIACLEEEVAALPDGVMTILGEGGERLSGGQKQRILVARAVASNPSLLLMDEATSALDLETERRLHKNLASLGCTRIVIAHRPMTTLDADRVIVLEDGKIVQDGTPAALLAMPGHLADMIQRLGGDA